MLPPIRLVTVCELTVDLSCDEFGVCTTAGGPAELPQLSSRAVVLMDRRVNLARGLVAGPIAIDRRGHLLDKSGEASLVVGGDPFEGGPSCLLGSHARTLSSALYVRAEDGFASMPVPPFR